MILRIGRKLNIGFYFKCPKSPLSITICIELLLFVSYTLNALECH